MIRDLLGVKHAAALFERHRQTDRRRKGQKR
jgi:hypothetical protein